jgi:hypothetical protein
MIPGQGDLPAGQPAGATSARDAGAVYALAWARRPAENAAGREVRASRADALLPDVTRNFVLPFLLAALRPDAKRWLGPDRLARLATTLRLKHAALSRLLDAVPQPPDALSEAGPWTGRSVPLVGPAGQADWIDLFWRPDRIPAVRGDVSRPAEIRPDRGGFAIRLSLPATGRIEIRGRLEGIRLDAVMETEHALPRPVAADVVESFEAVLGQLRLAGKLTIGGTNGHRRT